MKEKNSVLIQPKKLSTFIENLKTLVDSQYDASFKLTQLAEPDGTKKQFIEIVGTSQEAGNSFRNNVEITTIFNMNNYPTKFEPK